MDTNYNPNTEAYFVTKMHTIYDEFDLGGLPKEEARAINAIAPVGQRLEDALRDEYQLQAHAGLTGSLSRAAEMSGGRKQKEEEEEVKSSEKRTQTGKGGIGSKPLQAGEDFRIPMR